MSEWKSIDSAPRDTKVLVTHVPAKGKPPIIIAVFDSGELRKHCRPWQIRHKVKLRWKPTHWHPLPEPPTG